MAETGNQFAGDGPEATFRKALAEGRFTIQQCDKCRKHVFYPRTLCNHCGSPSLTWKPAAGMGTVYSTSIERYRAEQGGDKNIAVVELDEGPRMLTRITDIAPAEVKIGMRVSAHIGEDSGIKMILFRKA
jgi:uncharacterized OB-fold protein